MTREEKIFTLRIDSRLLDYLKRRADRNYRSIAKELEFIVRELYLTDNDELENIVLKVFQAYNVAKEKSTDLNLSDNEEKMLLKNAAMELVDFVKSFNS